MAFKIFLFLVLTFPCFGAEDSPTTFQNLLSRLSPEQIQQMPELAYLTELKAMEKEGKALGEALSKEIDYLNQFGPEYFSQQLYTLRQIEKQFGQGPVWIDLATQIFQVYGVKPEGFDQYEYLWWTYFDLVKVYYTGKETAENPLMAFKIMAACAKEKACNMLRERMLYYLSIADYLPDSSHLDSVWERFTTDFKPMDAKQALQLLVASEAAMDDEVETTLPDDELFQACENVLGSTNQVLQAFGQLQQDLLNSGSASEQQMQQAYQSIGSLNDISGFKPVTFKFDSIQVRSVFSLLWDVMGSSQHAQPKIKFAENLPDHVVEIRNQHVPAVLVFSQLIDLFELDVKCHQDWLQIQPRASNPANAEKKLLISNFVTHYAYDANTQKVQMQWGQEFQYEGEVKNQIPDGQGVLTLNGDKISGQFKQGLLNGQGERVSATGHIIMRGQFKDGNLHGTGEYISTGTYLSNKAHWSGEFEQGGFTGEGVMFLPNDRYAQYANSAEGKPYLIRYSGPINASQPDGTGQCAFEKMEYSCTFYKGYFIGFEEISFLPVE